MSAPLTWQKSSFSGGGSGEDCVELAAEKTLPAAIHLRESDNPATVLTANRPGLAAFLAAIKTGTGAAHGPA
jgi:Domain of unknown function (DUF397)